MFSDNPDPYGAQLNSHHAFFNLAEILIYADDTRNTPALIEFEGVPAGYRDMDQRKSLKVLVRP